MNAVRLRIGGASAEAQHLLTAAISETQYKAGDSSRLVLIVWHEPGIIGNLRLCLGCWVETHAPVLNRQMDLQHQVSEFFIDATAKRSRRFAGEIVETEQANQCPIPTDHRKPGACGAAALIARRSARHPRRRMRRPCGPWLSQLATPPAASRACTRPCRCRGRSRSQQVLTARPRPGRLRTSPPT